MRESGGSGIRFTGAIERLWDSESLESRRREALLGKIDAASKDSGSGDMNAFVHVQTVDIYPKVNSTLFFYKFSSKLRMASPVVDTLPFKARFAVQVDLFELMISMTTR